MIRLPSRGVAFLGLVALSACTPDKGTSTTESPEVTSDASTAGMSTGGGPPTTGATSTTAPTTTTTVGESTDASTGTTQGAESSTTGGESSGDPTTVGDSTSSGNTTTADTTTADTTAADTTAADTTAADTGPPDVVCEGTSMSTLPGVTIVFPPQDCSFTIAEAHSGIEFAYEVHIDAPIADVLRFRQDAGHCDEPGPSGLILAPRISGNGQNYCHCNQGLCPGLDLPPVTLQPGVYPGVLEWSGWNWNGPHEDPGPEFPPGEYVVKERAIGSVKVEDVDTMYEIVATLPITLVP